MIVALLCGARISPAATGPWMAMLGYVFFGPVLTLLPQTALGGWMLILARWLWSGHRRLRSALLATHGFLLLLGALFIANGFHAVAAANRSTANGGGLLSPLAYLPFLYGVPLVVVSLGSIAVAITGSRTASTDTPPRRNV